MMNNTVESLIESIILEGDVAKHTSDGDLYNFMLPAQKIMHNLERSYDTDIVAPIISALRVMDDTNPSVRVLLGALFRLLPIERMRNSYLEAREHTYLDSRDLFPVDMIEAIERIAISPAEDIAITALNACSKIGTEETLSICMDLIETENELIKSSAILNASGSPSLDDMNRKILIDLFFTSNDETVKIQCFDALFYDNLSAISQRELSLDDSSVAKEIDFDKIGYVDTLLDLGEEAYPELTKKVLSEHDLVSLPDETLRRIARNRAVDGKTIRKSLEVVNNSIASTDFTRDAKFGLLIHRNSGLSSLYVGHAGIYVGNDNVIHCTTGHDPHACHRTSLTDWKSSGGEFWGFRSDRRRPNVDLLRAVNRAREIISWRTKYDGTHNNQKGRWFNKCVKRRWWGECVKTKRDYWEADCVGFAEHLYEHSDGDPTDISYEVGLGGWPLTVREQRDNMKIVSR